LACRCLDHGARRIARFLLVDEPSSTLDSLTRYDLQDTLQVWEQSRKTVVMVTQDVDEALYLADWLLLMTDGPAATIGETLSLPFPRPLERAAVLEHPDEYSYPCHQTDHRFSRISCAPVESWLKIPPPAEPFGT
jgi:ABC-type nitrate/sulfonate/bicarbonate transport system ATPase subunit